MTQEEKAKRYDEALKVAKDIRNGKATYIPNGTPVIESIFPELKESEDEKIRKEIISAVNIYCSEYHRGTKVRNDMLAWVEKQGEQKTLGYVHHIDINGNYTKEPIKDIKHPNPYSGVGFECEGHYYGMCARDYGIEIAIDRKLICYISSEGEIRNFSKGNSVQNNEKLQGEQKPTDTLKFKIGDWVVFNNKHQSIYQVEKIEDGYYILRHTHGGTFRVCVLHDESLRPWTIQDAKDGDVLVCIGKYGQEIGIIKEYVGKHGGCDKCFETYCFVDWDGIFRTGEYMGSKEIHPATKEQRNTLEKAMADAGYIFDFEKKELKKIEDENYDGEDYGIDSLWHAQRILEKTLGKVDGYQSDDGILEHKCAISAVKQLSEQNLAWSEEDEKCIRLSTDIIDSALRAGFCVQLDRDRCVDWLKSLKDRVLPQPKQEWSEEDERLFQIVIDILDRQNHLGNISRTDLIACVRKLKSLRPQKQWKPSEEQFKVLNEVLNFAANHESPYWNDYIFGTLNNLIKQLKKLKGK